MNKALHFLWVLSTLVSQPTWAFTVSVNTHLLGFVAGRTSGHEEITRQAINRLEQSLVGSGIDIQSIAPELLADRDANPLGTKGFSVSNKIIQGNYATDIPFAWANVFDLASFYGASETTWQFSPKVQFLHFLQNRNADGTLVSQSDTCRAAREQIIAVTVTGARLWQMGLKRAALFLFGHSSHTIQDSFSPAHTIRDGKERNNNILKICYYGTAQSLGPDSCYHLPVDPRDGIWIRTPDQLATTMRESPHEAAALVPYIPVVTSFIAFSGLKESNLKHEARLARTATMRYFYLVATYLKSAQASDLEMAELRKILNEKLFDGRTGMLAVDQGLESADAKVPIPMPDGIIRCDRLDPKASAILPSAKEILEFTNSADDPQGRDSAKKSDR